MGFCAVLVLSRLLLHSYSELVILCPAKLPRCVCRVEKWTPGADLGMIRSQLSRAFRVWSDVSRLTFHEVRSGADISVSFLEGRHGDGYPFDGKGAVLAHAFFPGEGIGGDAHFDGAEMWTSAHADPDEEAGVNLFAVAAHEFGHSLGLSHSSVPGSLMFPYYQGIGENFQLPFDDRVGIQQLYGAKNPIRWGPMVTRPPQHQTPRPPPPPQPTRRPPEPTRRPPEPTRRPPPSQRPPVIDKPPPDNCITSFDALSVIRRELFIFKDRWFWRVTDNRLMKGYPVTIDRFWYDLPPTLERIDAVYERPIDTKIVFFSGRSKETLGDAGQRFWIYNANRPERGYPQPLTALGLPADLKRLDAAMVWGHNGKTYFFAGRRYWRFDETVGRVEPDYPRDMSMWRGAPYHLDAAFQWIDGKFSFLFGHCRGSMAQREAKTRERLQWPSNCRQSNCYSTGFLVV
ncbi:MMP15 [Cordylochernes scorpioides]|uniref:MMP15 n=1 Tax=Cordylochernes scorpioides TaxID=51811 RepID=A0ABY6JYG0_9ARAC|nr:MMP15 [Cordylochernes scorpioides]